MIRILDEQKRQEQMNKRQTYNPTHWPYIVVQGQLSSMSGMMEEKENPWFVLDRHPLKSKVLRTSRVPVTVSTFQMSSSQ